MNFNWLVLSEIVLVVVIGVVLYLLARRGIRSIERRHIVSLQSSLIITSVIKWAFIVTITLTCLNIFGISATSLWASLSAVLMLVALGFVAVWSILSNASCALFLVIFSPFRIGDEIEIIEPAMLDPQKPGLRGRVITISFIYTTVAETDSEGYENLVHVPNNQLFQKAIRCRKGTNTSSLKEALFEKTPELEKEKV